MSVYREGYSIVEIYDREAKQIWDGLCDYGVLVIKGDNNWNIFRQLAEQYGVKESRTTDKHSTGLTISIQIELLNEWKYEDDRGDGIIKPRSEYEDNFKLTYITSTAIKGWDGFVCLEKI